MTRPWLDQTSSLGDKNRPNWWSCSGHRPANIVPFDRPVLTAGGTDSPLPAFENRAVRYSPVVTAARDGREAAARYSPPYQTSDFPRSNYLHHIAASDSSASR